ncbi:hypothetical protein [Deinococcus soli (ex Cha et al. 2016)]|uniref:Uncharacterized protein n=2 Tax=Deinococcus soli (ex Cha et al. 2016) TaxID=1309411 RepID=A0AAE4BLU2_9DEIO|nr:hypothetical protein [Deinococcus soli (ex Cha et al. 2016)]MDR6218375.1 hypothetical protein [Deinococcus soli (ex Cha et al. 2016)]MDR6329115.1 hypothetical protein [Deinococcus soli (ex Cha et al. 2016)]MDR6751388.1 hypothetical protein [Deinococcus soli (ex Cha et al. 2016)]
MNTSITLTLAAMRHVTTLENTAALLGTLDAGTLRFSGDTLSVNAQPWTDLEHAPHVPQRLWREPRDIAAALLFAGMTPEGTFTHADIREAATAAQIRLDEQYFAPDTLPRTDGELAALTYRTALHTHLANFIGAPGPLGDLARALRDGHLDVLIGQRDGTAVTVPCPPDLSTLSVVGFTADAAPERLKPADVERFCAEIGPFDAQITRLLPAYARSGWAPSEEDPTGQAVVPGARLTLERYNGQLLTRVHHEDQDAPDTSVIRTDDAGPTPPDMSGTSAPDA